MPMPGSGIAAWPRIEAALDQLLDLPATERPAALQRLAGGDMTILTELRLLLDQANRDPTWLDRPADGPQESEAAQFPPVNALAPGQRIGPYELVQMIGIGGMGCVYRAQRVDGQYEQQVALKLIRPEAIEQVERFQTERQILAKLDHPSITRILDGGLFDGQLYMVMELVEGVPITAWCRDRGIGLEGRLELFLAVCDAVAYAHRNLIVHRDIKPGNILITPEGQVKLLDFGIAKRIAATPGDETGDATGFAPLSLSYAAPEQFLGGAISTATDIYGLGMLLFELLAGAQPCPLGDMPLARALQKVLHEGVPSLFQFVSRQEAGAPVPAKALKGDLDAIVAKAVRREPEHRYPTVDALRMDLSNHLERKPVSARHWSRLYVARCFVRRHRIPIAAATLIVVTLLGGLAGISWQYVRAEREASRANTIKAFVLSLYAGNDPAFPKDKSRRDITAEQLLDLGVGRIEREFAQNPDLEIELYTMTGSLYEALSDPDRAGETYKKAASVARVAYGDSHPLALRSTLDAGWFALQTRDLAKVQLTLDKLDEVLRASHQDRSIFRAEWWILKAQLKAREPNTAAEQMEDMSQALRLAEATDPGGSLHMNALQFTANLKSYAGDYETAEKLYRTAIDIREKMPGKSREGKDMVYLIMNRAWIQNMLGQVEETRQSYRKCQDLSLAVWGQSTTYWLCKGNEADLLHQQGKREEADALFESLMAELPAGSTLEGAADFDRVTYAASLSSEGRASAALELLEPIRIAGSKALPHPQQLRKLYATLAVAYQQMGRDAEARENFAATIAGFADEPKSMESYNIRGKWASYLVERGSPGEAAPVIDPIIADEDKMLAISAAPTRAWAGRAKLALRNGDNDDALSAIGHAFADYDRLRALHDVRIHTTLLLTRSEILLAKGDKQGALRDATEALADAERMDAPESPVIRQAREAVANASR